MASVVIITPRDADPPLEVVSFKVRMPRYGGMAIASYLAAKGHRVRLYDEFAGSRVDWDAVARADFVCFSVLSFSAIRAYRLADRARREYGRTVIMGGSHPSVVPEDALEHADYVIRNEGEEALLELIDALQTGGDVTSIPGLSCRGPDGVPVHVPCRRFSTDLSIQLNLDVLPEFRPWGLLDTLRDALAQGGVPRFALPLVQATRGCPFNCRFCFVKYEQGTRYRKRNLDVVLADIDRYKRIFKTPYLFFVDNDLLLDSRFACELFQQLLERYGSKLRPYLYSRAQVSANDELLRILEQFERTTIGVGFESISDSTLEDFHKDQSADEVLAAVDRFHRYGIHLDGLFLFGGDHDTPDTIPRTMDFCIRQRFYNLTVNALYDFPTRQSVLGHEQMIPDHLFIHRDWRFFSGNFAVFFPRRMRPSQLQLGIIEGFQRFYRKLPGTLYQFMPIRDTIYSYVEYLRRVEEPFYDRNDCRLDERLAGRGVDDLPRHVEVKVSGLSPYLEAARFAAYNMYRGVSWNFLRTLMDSIHPVR